MACTNHNITVATYFNFGWSLCYGIMFVGWPFVLLLSTTINLDPTSLSIVPKHCQYEGAHTVCLHFTAPYFCGTSLYSALVTTLSFPGLTNCYLQVLAYLYLDILFLFESELLMCSYLNVLFLDLHLFRRLSSLSFGIIS
jgi:hypothetical protein